MQGLLFDKSLVDVAVERIRTFEPPEGYWLAFSGGKDSVVLKALADISGVKYEPHYSVTGIDPPELVRFIRDIHPDAK
ncbi:MAG TPA: phosphoadenosine phosphosulfate reductase, partial [Armatimonadota bacterium]|nr:phosphoadenosine phosphosulfate reductase [Armatimonadota bacterium]